jgi:hypothetical protein
VGFVTIGNTADFLQSARWTLQVARFNCLTLRQAARQRFERAWDRALLVVAYDGQFL